MKLLLILCVITLAGCDTCPVREPVIVTQTVEVPVEVKCQVSYPKTPPHRLVEVARDAKGYDKASAALQELEEQREYAKLLRAALGKCAVDIVTP